MRALVSTAPDAACRKPDASSSFGTWHSAFSTSLGTILATYPREVDTVARYMGQAVALLENLNVEQDRIISQLQTMLAQNHSLRRADFDRIFAGVLARRDQARAPLARVVNNYRAGRAAVLAELANLFKCNVARTRQIWPGLRARLLQESEDDAGRAVAVLRRIHVEQEELSAALAALAELQAQLPPGRKLKIADLRMVANRLAKRDPGHTAKLADLLAGCESAARQAGEKWRKLAG